MEPVQDSSQPAKRGHSAILALAGLAGNGACVCAESHDICCGMGANILLEPAQLGAFGGDESASVKAGVRWRRLAGWEEGVGGRSGLGGRSALLSPVGCAILFTAGKVKDCCDATMLIRQLLKDLWKPHQHSQQRLTEQILVFTVLKPHAL